MVVPWFFQGFLLFFYGVSMVFASMEKMDKHGDMVWKVIVYVSICIGNNHHPN